MVEDALPAANCGGCGFPGCRSFAEALVGAQSLEGFYCPVGGNRIREDDLRRVGELAQSGDGRFDTAADFPLFVQSLDDDRHTGQMGGANRLGAISVADQ